MKEETGLYFEREVSLRVLDPLLSAFNKCLAMEGFSAIFNTTHIIIYNEQ